MSFVLRTWLGAGGGSSSGGGPPAFPTIGSATTIALIRDRMLDVIEQLVPTLLPRDRFVRYRNEGQGVFKTWADGNPEAAFRRFQVRTSALPRPPETSNTDYEQQLFDVTITIAYPQNGRAGAKGALSRDDVGDDDRIKIIQAIGMNGRANFAAPHPEACWRAAADPRVDIGAACDFTVITQTMMYLRSVAAG